ncbi:hypothetical protein ACG98H_04670 [Corynebacterium sp. L4756]|uniref:ApeA N-terminal domain 1-containing protein n=1 Tax=unclassified Corynebacterium TaxID=2624378 RepID=UPI00374D8641
MDSIQTTGEFWIPNQSDRRVQGTLFWEPGAKARVTLRNRVIEELANPIQVANNEVSMTTSGDPALIVQDSVPRMLFGETEVGSVTCIDSYLQHPPGNFMNMAAIFSQVWDPFTLVVGAHLPEGNAEKLNAVRLILDSPAWWRHLPDFGSVKSEIGEVRCKRNEDGSVWLEFNSSTDLDIRSAARVVQSMLTLMKLAVDVEVAPHRVQVRERNKETWLEVKTRKLNATKSSSPDPHNLLPPSAVTLERIVRWLEIEKYMDGLAAAVAWPVKDAAIQVKCLVTCSLIEGMHKRIVDPEEIHYADRADHLHSIATRISPDITDPVVEWKKMVKNVRNDLSHHNTVRSFNEQFYNWLIVESSANWVLRLCLLSHAGFRDEEISDALKHHQRYQFYRENLKMHVQELEAEKEAR